MLHKPIIPLSVLLIPLLGIVLVACEQKKQDTQENTINTKAELPKLSVDVLIAKELELNQNEVIVGTMIPYREVAIVSELSQKITGVAFNEGSYVTKGTILYTLNDADIKSRLKQVGAELELAQLNKRRLYNLLQTETIKQQEYDEAMMQLRSLEAQQELLRVELSKTIIKAPFSGKIGISKVHVGAYVSPGIPLVTLQDQDNLKINFSIPERYLPMVQTGNKVGFTTELSSQQYTATITATESGLDALGRSLQVQAIVNNSAKQFRAGLSTKVYFGTGGKGTKGINVPTEALIPGEGGYNAFVIANGKAKPVVVAVSSRTERDAIIKSGLASGDSIIISNILRITEGTPVKAIIHNQINNRL